MEKVEYKGKVINKVTNSVVLSNVFVHYDEENEIYWVTDNVLVDDEETKVDIAFVLSNEGVPIGMVYNSYFNGYDCLQYDIPLQEAYNNYKKVLAQNIILDKNKKYDDYIVLSKKFIASHKRKQGKNDA